MLGQRFVLVGGFGVFGNDVPGVQETRDKAENTKKNVDERIGAADATFDPD